jgi:predicted nicotinamide N-methyase
LKLFISEINSKITRVALDLTDDELYTKENAIADLSELGDIIYQSYPRKG